MTYRAAAWLAAGYVAVYSTIFLVFPMAANADTSTGFLALRSFLGGHELNYLVGADPANISKNAKEFLTWWSPGQYAVALPFATAGLKLGPVLSLISAACAVIGLLGWLRLMKRFDLPPAAAFLFVLCVGMTRHFVLMFGIYSGGETLMFAGAPWALIFAYEIPRLKAWQSFLLALIMAPVMFFLKLTGLIVLAVAMTSASLVVLSNRRRITPGMVGGAAGALIAVAVVYMFWQSRGASPATGLLPPQLWGPLVAFTIPWAAGMSLSDLLSYSFYNLHRPILSNQGLLGALLAPVALAIAATLFWGRSVFVGERKALLVYGLLFAGLFSTGMAILYLRGGAISFEERHFRISGLLLLVLLAAVLTGERTPKFVRASFAALAVLLAAYGAASGILRVLSLVPANVDSYSRINLLGIDQRSTALLRDVVRSEGRAALIVIPAVASVSLPPEARTLVLQMERPASELAAKPIRGVVEGSIALLLPRDAVDAVKEQVVRDSFIDYRDKKWKRYDFGNSVVLIHAPAGIARNIESER